MGESEFSFLDILSILSFALSVANYEENIDQSSMSQTVNTAVDDIHNHLNEQDGKIDKIINMLGVTE